MLSPAYWRVALSFRLLQCQGLHQEEEQEAEKESDEIFNFSLNLLIVRSYTEVKCHMMTEFQKRFNGSDQSNSYH